MADEGWTEIVDHKRKRREKKQQIKRNIKQQQQAQKRKQQQLEQPVKLAQEVDEFYKQNEQQAQHKPKRKKKKNKTINNEQELVDLVERIAENTATGYVLVADIGNRVTNITNAHWNKKFKSKYGTIPEFLQRHNDVFHFDPSTLRVFTRANYKRIAKKQKNRAKKAKEQIQDDTALTSEDSEEEKLDEAGRPSASKRRGSRSSKKRDGRCAQTLLQLLLAMFVVLFGIAIMVVLRLES